MSGLGFKQSFEQRQAQQLVLTPQMRQSIKILQAATFDLRNVIQEELQSNPTLEELPMEEISFEKNIGSGTDGFGPDNDVREEMSFKQDFQVLEKIDQDWRDQIADVSGTRTTSPEEEEHQQYLFESLTTEISLAEHLIQQIELAECETPVREAIRYLVGSLDDRGFLTDTLSNIALMYNLSFKTVQIGSKLLKTFDPLGIGSESLGDCLLVQLVQKGREKSVAAWIIRDHFDLFIRRKIHNLAHKTGLSPRTIQKAVEEIRKLDPAPGRRFANNTNRIVAPDVTVEREGAKWKVSLNNDYTPRLRLSSTYKNLIAKAELSKNERDYLREKLCSGKFIINAIEQRHHTIECITQEILKHQVEFFEEGVSKLKPLTMAKIASMIGAHEATVSRTLANKYIKTPHGVFAMKYFFTSGYKLESGQYVANTSIKEIIADIVASEDPDAPLSDQEIVGLLQKKGLRIARRTVTKYREKLGLLSSNLRPRYN